MITIINGTNREENNSLIISKVLKKAVEENGKEAQILELDDIANNLINKNKYGELGDDLKLFLKQYITDAEKIIFVIPEYNGSFPGVLKTFIDYSDPKAYLGKKTGLVGLSSGRTGNTRGLDHFLGVLHYLRAEVMAFKPKLSLIDGAINSERELDNKEYLMNLNNFVGMLIKF